MLLRMEEKYRVEFPLRSAEQLNARDHEWELKDNCNFTGPHGPSRPLTRFGELQSMCGGEQVDCRVKGD